MCLEQLSDLQSASFWCVEEGPRKKKPCLINAEDVLQRLATCSLPEKAKTLLYSFAIYIAGVSVKSFTHKTIARVS